MSMKIPCIFQVISIGSCATVRTSLWRHSDTPQCLEASRLKTSGHKSNTVQTLGQASPISTRSCILVDTIWKVSTRRLDDVATRLALPSIPEYFGFPLRTRKGVIVKTVRNLGQAIQTWSYFGKNCAILERWLQKTIRIRVSYRPDAPQPESEFV
jgi:hypothetical protein